MVDLITFQFNNFYVVSQIYNKAINFFFDDRTYMYLPPLQERCLQRKLEQILFLLD